MIPVLTLDPASLTLQLDGTHITQRPGGEALLQVFEHAYRGEVPELRALLTNLDDAALQSRCANFASCVWHEKRHFVDFLLTNYGAFRIRQYFQLYANLHLLIGDAHQNKRPVWLPLDVYLDPVTKYSLGVIGDWPNAEVIGANMRSLRDLVAEDRRAYGNDADGWFEFGGDAQFEGLAWIFQIAALQGLLSAEFSTIAQQDMSHFSVNRQRYRWSEQVAVGLGLAPLTNGGRDVSVIVPLLFAALQIRAYGQSKTVPRSEMASLSFNRLGALSERMRQDPKRFLSLTVDEAWKRINEVCLDVWGRTAIEEMEVDYKHETAFLDELVNNNGVSEIVTTCFADYHNLRGRLLSLLVDAPALVLEPSVFVSQMLQRLQPLPIWCRADGVPGKPVDGLSLIHGFYDDAAKPEIGWWWAALREYKDPKAIGFEHTSMWGGLTSHLAPTAKLMMNGRAHRTMIGPDIFSAEQRLRATGLAIRIDPARAYPREDSVSQMNAFYILRGTDVAVCDLCKKGIKKPEGRLLPPWLFRHNTGVAETAIAALSPTGEETETSRRRFWRDWSPWVSCDACFNAMLKYEAFRVAFEATCSDRSDLETLSIAV